MDVVLLTAAEENRLRALPLTYDVDATPGSPPRGYTTLSRSRVLRRRDFSRAADELLGWHVQRRAGLGVRPSSSRAETGSVVQLELGRPPLALRFGCQVVRVVAEPDRRGFAYGTLRGHPESGEELFVVTRDAAGQITFTISAFSRPGRAITRLAGPVGRAFQRRMIDRYLEALDEPSDG